MACGSSSRNTRALMRSVSGDITAGEVVAEAERLFAAAPAGDGGPDPRPSVATAALDRAAMVRPSAQAQAAGVGHDYPERYVGAVKAVSALDVQRVAGAYLAAPTIVSLGPSPQ